ncbi:lipocalin family protein [Emticicia sp. BO119]|uniref:lipocalin family protein n=1 Tax=Emticicia sp. BO119 TaxID=2757768 RepID=UPI0015F0BC21|nr:lipocalin family protein [Emticicia sp. BO119]MBA4851993.1 lipocalin family protein [Emticicia sp. BO119]
MKASLVIRKLTVLLVLSAMALFVMNCSKNDDDSPAPDASLSTQIKATWKVKNVYEKQGSAAETDQLPVYLLLYPCIKDASFTFQDNGNLTGTFSNDCKLAIGLILGGSENLKYEIKDNKLIITASGNTSTSFDLSFSGSDMILAATTSGVTRRIVFTKQ